MLYFLGDGKDDIFISQSTTNTAGFELNTALNLQGVRLVVVHHRKGNGMWLVKKDTDAKFPNKRAATNDGDPNEDICHEFNSDGWRCMEEIGMFHIMMVNALKTI